MAPSPHDQGYLLVGTAVPSCSSVRSILRILSGGYNGFPSDVPPVAGIARPPTPRGTGCSNPTAGPIRSPPPYPSASPTTAAIVSVANSQVTPTPTGALLQSLRAVRGVVCPVRNLGVGDRRSAHPVLSVHREHLRLGRRPHGSPPVHRLAAPRRRRPLRRRARSTATSLHVGLVMQVSPDGAIVTIEGDAGPGPSGSLAVVINGPYLPSQSPSYNGMPTAPSPSPDSLSSFAFLCGHLGTRFSAWR